jgi:hypothetical protein
MNPMSRRTRRKVIPELAGLETRNLMSGLPSAGIAGPTEVHGHVIVWLQARSFNPQPDPPGTDARAFGAVSFSGPTARARPTESL